MVEEGEVTGMAVELWEYISGEIGVAYDDRSFDTVAQLIDAVSAEKVDLAVANLTIAEKRATRIDFAQSWFDAGLRIMAEETPHVGFSGLFEGLEKGWVEAIIGDAPDLESFLRGNLQVERKVVGPIFQREKYGFGLPHGSPLKREMIREVVGAHEDGLIEKLRRQYFGAN